MLLNSMSISLFSMLVDTAPVDMVNIHCLQGFIHPWHHGAGIHPSTVSLNITISPY